MASFGNLYTFSTASGVVIPQTSEIRESVENAFQDIFGSFSTNPTTPNGRLIEAITLLFVDVCRVNAQNANGFNITQAVGNFLDGLGALFGVLRQDGESDASYRARIIASASRGSGFAASIRNAISSEVTGVRGVVVLDNGNEDPDNLPKDNLGAPQPNAISVAGHSVFICVRGGDDTRIAEKIRNTISAGCGYTTAAEFGTVTSKTITDTATNTSFTAKFYRPTPLYVKAEIKVNGGAYTGDDIVADTKDAVLQLLDENAMNSSVDKNEIIAAVAALGKNIVCTEIKLKRSDSDSTLATGTEVDEVIVFPYKYIATGDTEAERAEFKASNIIVTEV